MYITFTLFVVLLKIIIMKGCDEKVLITRKYLKQNLVMRKKLRGFASEKSQLLSILKRTILNGESDSVLIIGPPGCGKTTLVSDCFQELTGQKGFQDVIVVNLNGLVHRDDNLALREIIQQLHLEELEGDKISGTFADNLTFLLQSLRSGTKDVTKPIIFVLNEFQCFCQHRNQTLLYNLFDVAQSAKAPTCVIGLTCRIDITEMLEKRVKSRFSHRQILLLPNPNFKDRLDAFLEYLSLPQNPKDELYSTLGGTYIKKWNEGIKGLLDIPRVNQLLRRQFELEFNEKKFKSTLFQMVCFLDSDSTSITPKIVDEVLKIYDVDEKVQLLKDLSVLELCLVIAMSHHAEIYENTAFNFEMILGRYLKFANQYAVQLNQRPILLKAFERIKELEIILPVSGGQKTCKKEFQLYNFALMKSQVDEAINEFIGLPTEVSQWATSIT